MNSRSKVTMERADPESKRAPVVRSITRRLAVFF